MHKLPGPIKELSLLTWVKGVFVEINEEAFMKPQERWWKQAGIDTPLIHWTGMFGQHFLMTVDADCVKQILTSKVDVDPLYMKNYVVVKRSLGDGLVTANGSIWHRHRRIIQPAFDTKALENKLSCVVPGLVNRLIQSWKSKEGNDVDVASHFSALTLDVIGIVAFSHDFQATDAVEKWSSDINPSVKLHDPLIRALRKELSPNILRMLLASFNLQRFDDTILRSTRENRKVLNDAVGAVVKKAKVSHSLSESGRKKCLLELLFDAEDAHSGHEKRKLSFKELRDETKTVLISGHDTTSTLCAFAVYRLTKHPHIQKLVFKDIMDHTTSTDGPITLEMIKKMTYFDAFLHEVLRLHPPVGMIARDLSRRTNLVGESIPAGTRIQISIYLLHRNPKYWTDPEEFKPERWQERDEKFHHFAFLPFSAGGRNCIGQRFAMYEAKLILAPIIREFEMMLSPSQENVDFKHVNFITLKIIPSVKVRVKRRL